MKCVVELSKDEEMTLERESINHIHRDIRTRAAGILLLGRKVKVTEIVARLGVSDQSLYNWAYDWRERGLHCLDAGHKGGRPRVLSDAMIATAIEAAQSESRTLKQIAQRIEEVHGIPFPCGLDTLAKALKRAGFSYKRGRYSLKKTG